MKHALEETATNEANREYGKKAHEEQASFNEKAPDAVREAYDALGRSRH